MQDCSVWSRYACHTFQGLSCFEASAAGFLGSEVHDERLRYAVLVFTNHLHLLCAKTVILLFVIISMTTQQEPSELTWQKPSRSSEKKKNHGASCLSGPFAHEVQNLTLGGCLPFFSHLEK